MTTETDKKMVEQIIKTIKDDPNLREELVNNLIPREFVKRDELKEILEEIRLMRLDSNERFEVMEKRFDEQNKMFEKRFEEQRKDSNRQFEAIDKRFEEQRKESITQFEAIDKRFEEQLKESNKQFEERQKEHEKLSIGIMRIENKEGPYLKKLILGVMEETLKLENIDVEKIRKEHITDTKGQIFFEGFTTDIDLLVEDGNVYLIEIKATTGSQDIAHFLQKKKLFELDHGKKVTGLILISLRMNIATYDFAVHREIKPIAGSMID